MSFVSQKKDDQPSIIIKPQEVEEVNKVNSHLNITVQKAGFEYNDNNEHPILKNTNSIKTNSNTFTSSHNENEEEKIKNEISPIRGKKCILVQTALPSLESFLLEKHHSNIQRISNTMTPIVKKPLYMVLSLLSNETTNHEYVGYLFDHFVTSCIITHEDVKTEKEVILRLEDDKKEITRLTMTSTSSGDREVISELLIDDSLQWIKQIKGLSVLDSLNKLTSINSSKFFTPVSVKRTVVQLIDIPEKRIKHKPTLEEKLSDKSYLRRYLIHENPTIISSIIGKNLDTFMQQYNNLLSMTNLEVTLDSLSRLLSLSVPILPLFNILDQHACYADIPILCKTLSNENLKKLQLIATLSTYLTFQAAVTAVSLNRSDKPHP